MKTSKSTKVKRKLYTCGYITDNKMVCYNDYFKWNEKGNTQLEDLTLYTNGLMTINDRGYTKHYFTEGERICSSIGGGFTNSTLRINNGNGLVSPTKPMLKGDLYRLVKQVELTFDMCISNGVVNAMNNNLYYVMRNYENGGGSQEPAFYYHADHLGSTSYVTDKAGNVTQVMTYMPFGEQWIDLDYRAPSLITQFKFTGKELDLETGNYYVEHRYLMNPDVWNGWLSVDPMAHKFPHITPYNYCLNNPLKFIDPDGKLPWPVSQTWKGAIRYVISGFFRNDPATKFHGGVDIAHIPKTGRQIAGGNIIATHDGTVTASGYSKTAGNWVQITNGDLRTSYMHMESPSGLKIGDKINEADFVGTIGTTGHSFGNHLHYQIEQKNKENGKWEKVNPVVGDPEHVNKNKVELKDPQQMINERDKTKSEQKNSNINKQVNSNENK